MLCSDLKEVVGIDVMIKNLSLFLSKAKQKLHPEAKLYLISENEDLIAFSNEITPEPGKIYKLDKNIFPLLYHAIESEKNESFIKLVQQSKMVCKDREL